MPDYAEIAAEKLLASNAGRTLTDARVKALLAEAIRQGYSLGYGAGNGRNGW
jgi:hypothetical protein